MRSNRLQLNIVKFFELALTKSRQPLSSVTSAFTSTLMSLWGHTSPRPSLPASPYTASATKHSPIRPQICFLVVGNVTHFFTTGLRKSNPCRYSSVSAQASPVGNELRSLAGVPVVEVRPHHSASSRTSVVKGGWEDWLQACSPCLQVSAGSSTIVSRWRTSWAGGFRGTTSTTFRLVSDTLIVYLTYLLTMLDAAVDVVTVHYKSVWCFIFTK